MRFAGVGRYPKYLIIYDYSCGRKLVVHNKKEALEIVNALKNKFGLVFKKDPMTQEEATKFMKELENGWQRRT